MSDLSPGGLFRLYKRNVEESRNRLGLLGDIDRHVAGAGDTVATVGRDMLARVKSGIDASVAMADPAHRADALDHSADIANRSMSQSAGFVAPRTQEGGEKMDSLGRGMARAGEWFGNTPVGRPALDLLDRAQQFAPAPMAILAGSIDLLGPGKGRHALTNAAEDAFQREVREFLDRPGMREEQLRISNENRAELLRRESLDSAKPADRLTGLPEFATAGGEKLPVAPVPAARAAADAYRARTQLGHERPTDYVEVDPENGAKIARAYEEMPHAPDDPAVRASYRAMIDETVDQWREIEKTGLKVEFIKPGMADPYAKSPRHAIEDVRKNNHLWVYPTEQGFGSNAAVDVSKNPLLEMTDVEIDGRRLPANDVFRIVHDYFGHAKEGVGFRHAGEENAWRQHASMYSELARGAMTSETRGQNSWVNWGPHGEKNRAASAADTVYADQKTGLLPREFWSNEALGLKPREGAMFPQYAEQYPPLPAPVTKLDKKKGTTYPSRGTSPETDAFMAERSRIQDDIDANGFEPYFDPEQRFDADISRHPPQFDTRTQGLPKKQATIDKIREAIQTDAARQRLQGAYDAGTAAGYNDAWYKTGQIEREFIDEFGPVEGPKLFKERVADALAATTAGNAPEDNIMFAQYGNFLRSRGERAPEAGHQIPFPMRGQYMGNNMAGYNRVINDGNLLNTDQPKGHNFSRNILGDSKHSTIDAQMTDLIMPGKQAPPAGHYFAYEELVDEMARKNGLDPRDFQDVAWGGKKAGGGKYKGKPLVQSYNEAIERTHRLTGMSKKDIVRRGLIRGEIPLYGAAAAGLLAPFLYDHQKESDL